EAAASGTTPRASRRGTRILVALLAIVAIAFAAYFFVGKFSDLELASVTDHPTVVATIATSPVSISTVAATIAVRAMAATPTEGAIGSSAPKYWLAVLNGYRTSTHLAPVTDDPSFSDGDLQHSRYIVKNYHDQISTGASLGAEMHHEDPSKPWFSKEGAIAGLASDVDEMWDPSGSAKASWAIDDWMQGPFHRISLLDPQLHRVGYGSFCTEGVCIAALNVHGDSDHRLTRPVPLAAPITYPPDGGTISTNSFIAEWPDPLTSCPGYEAPAGFPITLQLGMLVEPGISRYALTTQGGASVEACAFDDSSYANLDSASQSIGRDVLRNYGAIVIVPRQPLRPGGYAVGITAGDERYTWSFTVKRP
ncbi:MAG TPA: CAP domain-containing protein, partial [Candidatus Binataceae bacterium]|nr:CAP domain-containing protein [Candidatus Binataceae bacterium]